MLPKLNKPSKYCQSLLKFSQSDEVSPNLVTLLACKGGRGSCSRCPRFDSIRIRWGKELNKLILFTDFSFLTIYLCCIFVYTLSFVFPSWLSKLIYKCFLADERILEYEVDHVVADVQSKYQHVVIINTVNFGNLLVLDELPSNGIFLQHIQQLS